MAISVKKKIPVAHTESHPKAPKKPTNIRPPKMPKAPKAPKAPGIPATPAAPAPAPVAVAPAKPTPSAKTTAGRITAEEVYQRKTSNLENQIYQAALRYGDPTTLAQFSRIGPVVANPNSQLERIRRGEVEGIRNVDNNSNRNNTFNSSIRLGGDQKVTEDANRNRQLAHENFQKAYHTWTTAVAENWAQYQESLRNLDAEDIEAALASPPEPTGILPTSPAAAPAKKISPKATGKIISTKAVPKKKPNPKGKGKVTETKSKPTVRKSSEKPKKTVKKKR